MKRNGTIWMSLLILTTFCMTSNVMAGSWINHVKVIDTRWYGSGKGFITIDQSVDPENCGSLSANVYIDTTMDQYEQFIKKGDLALIAGRYVNILVDGCYNDQYNKISGIVLTDEYTE